MRFLFINPNLFCLFALFIVQAALTERAIGQTIINNFRLYTTRDGLASNYVKNLLIDSKGYLWVGTLEGINRFDGASFTNLVTDPKDFTSRSVECINQVNDSIILIGTPPAWLYLTLTVTSSKTAE